MNLTIIAFKGMLSFQFVGCQLNAFTVNSHRSLMCGRLVLPHGKSSPSQRNSHTMACQISKLLKMQSKAWIVSCWQNQTRVHQKCMKSCWNAGYIAPNNEQHLRKSFRCSPPFTVIKYDYLYSYHECSLWLMLDKSPLIKHRFYLKFFYALAVYLTTVYKV